jgi:hypothetical protein
MARYSTAQARQASVPWRTVCKCRYQTEADRPVGQSSPLRWSAPEDVFRASELSQTLQRLKSGLYRQALVDYAPHGLGITARVQSLAKPPDFPGLKQEIGTRECCPAHGCLGCVGSPAMHLERVTWRYKPSSETSVNDSATDRRSHV